MFGGNNINYIDRVISGLKGYIVIHKDGVLKQFFIVSIISGNYDS